jgi:pimeloyl-ACP methyl ester carboxylesterase
LALLIACCFGVPAHAAPCMAPATCRTAMVVEGRKLPLYASENLDKPQPHIRRALIVVHGTEGNADSYFQTAVEAARVAGKLHETVVIAPRLVAEGDGENTGDGEFLWRRGADWRAGDLSARDMVPRLSSFELMSRLLSRIADPRLLPNLATIVLAGHSAGGQFVQRYAIGEPDSLSRAHLKMLYVVANPSSYLYLDAHRPDRDSPGGFVVPDRAKCQSNRFKYGFERPNAYFKEQSVEEMSDRYRERRVVYLLGENDINPDAEDLSRTCAAMAQGDTRFARGKNFMAYMDARHAPHAHRLVTVTGVGHSARAMFQSPRGLHVLFE